MNRKVLIGGAWPYANNSLHLGHLAALISGDVLARYHRQNGDKVIYVSGTDCHGTPITESAKKQNTTAKAIAEKYHKEFESAFSMMHFSYDLYTKTEASFHKEEVQKLFKKIYTNGYIVKKIDLDNYCDRCNKFVADRELKVVCPECNEESKGDQCDCGHVFSKEELVGAICVDCGNATTVKENKNLYLDLPKLQEEIARYVDSKKDNWRKNAINETEKYLKEGLMARAVTRNLDWGIDIPVEGFADKKMYVWIDAVLGYVTAAKEVAKTRGEDWKEYLFGENVKSYMVHGKDNIVFHSIIFPALLLGMKEKYHLPDVMVSTEYLNFHDKKFSKSQGIGLTVMQALEICDPDTLRFYLLKNGPENKDTNFTEDEYIAVHNEVVNKLGNFVNRTLKYKGLEKVPQGVVDVEIAKLVEEKYRVISNYIEKVEFRKVCQEIITLLEEANKYYDRMQPWIKYKENIQEFNDIIYTCAVVIVNLAKLVNPVMPGVTRKLQEYINLNNLDWKYISKVDVKKIDLSKVEILLEKK